MSAKYEPVKFWPSIIGPAQRGPIKPAPSVSQSVTKVLILPTIRFSDFLLQVSHIPGVTKKTLVNYDCKLLTSK